MVEARACCIIAMRSCERIRMHAPVLYTCAPHALLFCCAWMYNLLFETINQYPSQPSSAPTAWHRVQDKPSRTSSLAKGSAVTARSSLELMLC